jgi:hypothetical protein
MKATTKTGTTVNRKPIDKKSKALTKVKNILENKAKPGRIIEAQGKKWDTNKLHKANPDTFGMFDLIKSNRPVHEEHVLDLMQKITEKNLLHANPLIVSLGTRDLFEITDGQHRLEAARRLEVPVYFIIDNDLTIDDVPTINSFRRKWTPEDYVHHFVKEGRKDYKVLKEFAERTEISINTAIGLLSGKSSNLNTFITKQFHMGQFKVESLEHAEKVARLWDEFKKFGHRSINSRTFVNALSRVIQTDGYVHKRMIENMKTRHKAFVGCITMKEYIHAFEQVFNYKMDADKKISFVKEKEEELELA